MIIIQRSPTSSLSEFRSRSRQLVMEFMMYLPIVTDRFTLLGVIRIFLFLDDLDSRLGPGPDRHRIAWRRFKLIKLDISERWLKWL